MGRPMHDTLNDHIGEQVVDTLGSPGDLIKVHVRALWKDHYRVNVLVGRDAASARVANSYFLVTDDEGNIIASTPKISRLYGSNVAHG
jgi:hypothetical protein